MRLVRNCLVICAASCGFPLLAQTIHAAPEASGTGVDAANGSGSHDQSAFVMVWRLAAELPVPALPVLVVALGAPPRPHAHAAAIATTLRFTRAL